MTRPIQTRVVPASAGRPRSTHCRAAALTRTAWISSIILIAAAGAGIAAWLYASAGPNELGMPPPGAARGQNVLLVTFDTTRPDHLGLYGYSHARTPSIDGLGKRGITFLNATTTVPLTLPSHTTILTGQYPYRHGVRTNTGYELPQSAETLAERFKQAGYSTAAFVSCFVLDERFGLSQGFDTYDFAVTSKGRAGPESILNQRDAAAVTDAALNWLSKDRKVDGAPPFFLWVHYYDPHNPYVSPLANQPEFADRPYDAEIAYADAELGRLLSQLDRQGLRDSTLIVFTTDHGESLNEHGESGHGIFIYEATMRAALVFSSPSLFESELRIENHLAATTDIAPTLLSLLGLPALPDMDGIALNHQRIPADRMVFIESMYPKEGRGCAPYFGVRSLKAKFIDAPEPEFYDLVADRNELTNLYVNAPVEMVPCERELRELYAAFPQIRSGRGGVRSMTSAEIAQLESLGYAGGVTVSDEAVLPDAKHRIALFEKNEKAIELVKSGRVDEGLAMAEELMRQTDGFETPVHTVAHIYEGLGRHAEAVALLDEYVKRHPSTNLFLHLAKNLAVLNRWDEFERALRAAEVMEPKRGSIPLLRGDTYMQVGRYSDAVREYERAIEIDPHRIGSKERAKLERAKKLAGQ
ncbi:MAG: sulfatase-like hydrolase/transferase [Phycisphaerae bacterium]|nr:sulfatase-like hydrolase/transferase [Phycisphaerae bacterium]